MSSNYADERDWHMESKCCFNESEECSEPLYESNRTEDEAVAVEWVRAKLIALFAPWSPFEFYSLCCICHRTIDQPPAVDTYCIDCINFKWIGECPTAIEGCREKYGWRIEDRLENVSDTESKQDCLSGPVTLVRKLEVLEILEREKTRLQLLQQTTPTTNQENKRRRRRRRKEKSNMAPPTTNGNRKRKRKRKRRSKKQRKIEPAEVDQSIIRKEQPRMALPTVEKAKRKSKDEERERNPDVSGEEKERKHEQAEVDMESSGVEKGQKKKKRQAKLDTVSVINEQPDMLPEHKKKKKRKHEEAVLDLESRGAEKLRVELGTQPVIEEHSDMLPEHKKKKKKRKHEEAELDRETNGVEKRKKRKKQRTE